MTSVVDTELTSVDVRDPGAIGFKADVPWTSRLVRP